jgi:hypothetical protein
MILQQKDLLQKNKLECGLFEIFMLADFADFKLQDYASTQIKTKVREQIIYSLYNQLQFPYIQQLETNKSFNFEYFI